MSSDRDVTRIVRSWLDEGVTQLPDRVLDAVLDQVPATPQRRAWWLARRFPIMNSNAFRYGLAAVAVVVIALLGITFLPFSNIGDRPAPTASQIPSPSPTPSVMPAGNLEPGTYTVRVGSFTRRSFTVTVPAGWSHEDNFVAKGNVWDGNGVTFATWIVSHIYTDSCQHEGSLRQVGSAELADALAEQTGHETSGPTDVTLGGYPATRLEFSVSADFDASACDGSLIRLWPDAGPNENYGLPIYPGQTTTVYVVDLAGEAMLVVAVRKEGSSASDVAELQKIVDSIRFERFD
jgi:hypothetical protein